MKDTMGIILANNETIPPITDNRSILALPIAGRYRVADFVISAMANAGITNIGVAAKEKYSSLMDHIKSGRPWDLNRKQQGLNILPPNIGSAERAMSGGDADMLIGIKDFIRKSHQTYVILSMGSYIYNMDFDKVTDEHIKSRADITAVYTDMTGAEERELSRFVLYDIDSDGRIIDIESKPYYPKSVNAGLDIYVMEKALLESIVDECSARGNHDFVKDVLAQKTDGLRMFAYRHDGYAGKIDSLKAYYENNMNFLKSAVRGELLNPSNPINTKTKDLPPTKYGKEARIENSFVSDGCIIEGTVINSVLSRAVHIKKGAVVKNSIIMQETVVESGAELDYVVFDKEVHITEGRRLLGQRTFPLAIGKGIEI